VPRRNANIVYLQTNFLNFMGESRGWWIVTTIIHLLESFGRD